MRRLIPKNRSLATGIGRLGFNHERGNFFFGGARGAEGWKEVGAIRVERAGHVDSSPAPGCWLENERSLFVYEDGSGEARAVDGLAD
jgi:hypothetical protein